MVSKINSIEVLISKSLIDSNISYSELIVINDVLKELYGMKKEIKTFSDQIPSVSWIFHHSLHFHIY